MKTLGFLLLLSLLFLVIAITPTCSQEHVAMFVFGDSFYDPGNNNYLNNVSADVRVNYPPYGETYFKFPTGRASDGLLIPDFIALYANLSIWRPYMDPDNHNLSYGANFASCAASVLPNVPGVLDLETQFRLFKNVTSLLRQQLGDITATKVVKNAVYLINIGAGDYMSHGKSHMSTESSRLEFVKWVTGNLTNMIKEIYNTGGRKFAFQGLTPLGCLPRFKQAENVSKYECVEYLSTFSILHNNALFNLCMELDNQLSGFKYSILNSYEPVLERVKNPEKYGFKVSYMACCGKGQYRAAGHCGRDPGYELCKNPNEYLFWDRNHPTQHGYSQLAEMFWSGSSNATWPINLKQLFELDGDRI